MPSPSEISISRRAFLKLAGAAAAAEFFGSKKAFAQEPAANPNPVRINLPIVENTPLTEEQIDAQLLAEFRRMMEELTGAKSPNSSLIRIVSPENTTDAFDGRRELLKALPEMFRVVQEMIHTFNAVCLQYNCKPWAAWRGSQESISLKLHESSTLSGASTYYDQQEHRHQQILAKHGSVWETMRYFVEVLVADANLAGNGFENSDPFREAVVLSMTNFAVEAYLVKCVDLDILGKDVAKMKITVDGVLTSPTTTEYINAIQNELDSHTDARPVPFGAVLPERVVYGVDGMHFDYGVIPLYQSTLGSLPQKEELFERYIQLSTEIKNDEIARWEAAGNSFGDRRAVFEMRLHKLFQSSDASEYDALDAAMGWLDLTQAIKARLRSAGFTLDRSRFESEREKIASLAAQQPPTLQFMFFGNIGSAQGLDLHISELSCHNSETDTECKDPATLRAVQNKIEGDLEPVHYPMVWILFYVQDPITFKWRWVEGSIAYSVISEHGRCRLVFNNFVEYVNDDNQPIHLDLTGTALLAMMNVQQRNPVVDGAPLKTTILQQITKFEAQAMNGSNTSSEGAELFAPDTAFDQTLPIFDEGMLRRAEAGLL